MLRAGDDWQGVGGGHGAPAVGESRRMENVDVDVCECALCPLLCDRPLRVTSGSHSVARPTAMNLVALLRRASCRGLGWPSLRKKGQSQFLLGPANSTGNARATHVRDIVRAIAHANSSAQQPQQAELMADIINGITQLQEWIAGPGARYGLRISPSSPLFELITTTVVPPHAPTFTVRVTVTCPNGSQEAGEGQGTPRRAAEHNAARNTLLKLKDRFTAAAPAGTVATCDGEVSTQGSGTTKAEAKQRSAHHMLQMLQGLQPTWDAAAGFSQATAERPESAVERLQQYAARAAWHLDHVPEQVGGDAHKWRHRIYINGLLLGFGTGGSKESAQDMAADAVLRGGGRAAPAPGFGAFVQGVCLSKLQELDRQCSGFVRAADFSRTVVACFLVERAEPPNKANAPPAKRQKQGSQPPPQQQQQQQQSSQLPPPQHSSQPQLHQHGSQPPKGSDSGQLEVVALATGTRHWSGTDQHALAEPEARGRVLTDSHAEVLARRSLLRWLYGQAAAAAAAGASTGGSGSSSSTSVFELAPAAAGAAAGSGNAQSIGGRLLRLQQGVRLHMYVSKPPCGDATMFRSNPVEAEFTPLPGVHWPTDCCLLNPKAATIGRLRAKQPVGSRSLTPLPRPGDRPKHPLSKVACSDKLARWNALGVQGALLGQLLAQPLYLTSLTVGVDDVQGQRCTQGALARAVCCRLTPHVPDSPAYQTDHQADQQAGDAPSHQVDHQAGHTSCDHSAAAAAAAAAAGAAAAQPSGGPNWANVLQRSLRLSPPFRVSHPELHLTPPTVGMPCVAGAGGRETSLNWNEWEPCTLEVTDGVTGKRKLRLKLQPSGAAAVATAGRGGVVSGLGREGDVSRLSKVALGVLYVHTRQAMQRPDDVHHQASTGPAMTYRQAKDANTEYARARGLLYRHFEQLTNQAWLRRSEQAPGLEGFSIQTDGFE